MRKKMDHLPPTAGGVAYQIEAFGIVRWQICTKHNKLTKRFPSLQTLTYAFVTTSGESRFTIACKTANSITTVSIATTLSQIYNTFINI